MCAGKKYSSFLIAEPGSLKCICVILAEGVTLDDDTKAAASDKGINVLSTHFTAYETAVKLSKSLL